MNLLRKLIQIVRPQAAAHTEAQHLETFYALMEQAERYHHSEQYDVALQTLRDAETLSERLASPEKRMMIALARAGIFARQGRTDEAQRLLARLQQEGERDHDKLKLAYVLISLGVLAQEAEQWEQAEDQFDQALRYAREAKSTGAEGRAQAHLADVSLHNGNASFAVYLLKEALPKLNISGDVQLNSYFVGRLGEALIEVGDVSEGQQLLGRALRLAEHMGYRSYERQWRNALAIQAMIIGNYGDAKRHLMAVMASSKPDNPSYVVLLCRLSHASLRLGEYDVSHDYAKQSLELATEYTDQPELHLRAQAALGIVLRTMDHNSEALTHLEAASKGYDALGLTAADHSYVDVLRNLAAAQTVANHYDAATATYDLALAYATEHDNPADLAGTYRDRGIMFMQHQDLEAAIKNWVTARDIYDTLNEPARVARLYCDIASLRKQLGQWQRASEDYNEALMLLSSVDDDETRGIVLSNAAAAYVDQGDVQTAESFFIDAIKIAQKLNDRAAEATRRGNYGWFLLSTGRADRAMASLTYALRQSENLDMTLQAAVQTDNMGLAQVELGNLDEALSLQRQALTMIEPIDNANWEAIFHANIGQTLVLHARYAEAEVHFNEALTAGQLLSNYEVLIKAQVGLMRCAMQKGDLDTAKTMINNAVERAERLNTRRLLADALTAYSEYQIGIGDQEAATISWERARKLYNILHLPLHIRTPGWVENGTNASL